ncbi:MAG: hypothetical protein WDO13_00335 [Verrucomicrobiota bacterium]
MRRLPRVSIEDAPPDTPHLELTVLLPLQLADALGKDPVRIILEARRMGGSGDPAPQPFDPAVRAAGAAFAVNDEDERVLAALERLTGAAAGIKRRPARKDFLVPSRTRSARSSASPSAPPPSGRSSRSPRCPTARFKSVAAARRATVPQVSPSCPTGPSTAPRSRNPRRCPPAFPRTRSPSRAPTFPISSRGGCPHSSARATSPLRPASRISRSSWESPPSRSGSTARSPA